MPKMPLYAPRFPRKPAARASEHVQRQSTTVTNESTAKGNKSRSMPTTHTEKVFRVQKAKDVKIAPKIEYTAEKFSDQLDEHREHLFIDAEKGLQEAEIKHVDAIQTQADRFDQHLSLLSESEQQLVLSLAGEQVKVDVSLNKQNANGHGSPATVTLGQRMFEFDELVTAREETLAQLFDDWNSVQIDIIALAVQVFGRESVEVKKEQLHDGLAKAMEDAANSREVVHDQVAASLAEVTSLKTKAKDLKANTERVVEEAYQALVDELNKLQKELERTNKDIEETRRRFFSSL